jgi:predicted Zn-dependent protease
MTPDVSAARQVCARPEQEMHSRRIWQGSFLLLGLVIAGGYGGLRAIEARRFQSGLEKSRNDIAAGSYRNARKQLVELSRSQAGDGEVEYLLGLCEMHQGRRTAALTAWEHVKPTSAFAARATIQRALVMMEAGQYTRAEEILDAARGRATGTDDLGLLHALGVVYEVEGRADDLRKSIVDCWQYSDTPETLLRKLAGQETAPLPVGRLQQALEKNPQDDDGIWLGRINLATRTGQFELANNVLEHCLARRPNDPVVWRAALELAQASGEPALAWRALEHLPADAASAVELARIRAWLIAGTGEIQTERVALAALLKQDPADTVALERLATLAAGAGDDQEVSRLRARITDVTTAKDRYLSLIKDESGASDPAAMARLAEFLGRTIEARGWALVRGGKLDRPGPSRPLLVPDQRIGRAPSDGSGSGRSYADLCADLRKVSPSRPPAGSTRVMPQFVDEAEPAGLRFVQDNAESSQRLPPETMSGGVALFDYDGDGWLDVYAVQGGPLPPSPNSRCADRLFRNRGDGTFEDVSERAGLHQLAGGYGHGVAVGDYDNDGHPDLFVTRWRSYALVRNRGDGTFEDVTGQAGLSGDRDWPTSAAWADLDGDGDLDLYVCHYMVFDLAKPRLCVSPTAPVNHYCSPRDFETLPDHVFRNDGGRFVDVTKAAGFVDPNGRGLGALAADLDDDNRIDLYVANDMSANYLFHNLGSFHFEETALAAGAAANSSGGFQSGMGVACGDFDGDGRPDLAVTNFYGESTTYFRNLGRGMFSDDTAMIGLAGPTRCLLGFGIAFLDANNDGWLDLLSANGHVNDHRPALPWRMPTQLLLGGPDGRLKVPYPDCGEAFKPAHLGRGLAVGDLDNDGQIDAVVQAQNEPLAYLHNRSSAGGHWVVLQLEGVRSNRDAVGSRVTLLAGGRQRVAQRTGGGSYQSANDPRLHFGLGESEQIERLEIRWPSGLVQSFAGLPADRGYLLREGAAVVKPLRGWERRTDRAAAK